jgi:hypothetical protein
MNFTILFASAIISLLIGIIFGIIDNAKNEQSRFSKIFRIAEKSLVYSILGLALTTIISIISSTEKINNTLSMLDKSLSESDKYYKASETINEIKSPTVQSLFNQGLGRITRGLEEMSLEEKMYVPREEIWNVWESLVKSAEKEILVTNLVSKEDWKHVSQDGTGMGLQQDAIENRGVIIRRVFIYDDENQEHISGLYNLAKMQSSVGIQVKFILRKEIERNSSVQDDLRALQRILDVVITDEQSILLTEVESGTYIMRWSYLIYERNTIERGVHFWQRAWDTANSMQDFENKYKKILNLD